MQIDNKAGLVKAVSGIMLASVGTGALLVAQSPRAQVAQLNSSIELAKSQSALTSHQFAHPSNGSQSNRVVDRSPESQARRGFSSNLSRESRVIKKPSKEIAERFRQQSSRSHAAEKEARRLFKQRRFAEAKAACYRSLALSPKINGDPTNKTCLVLLGNVCLEQKEYKEALKAYEQARKNAAGGVEAYLGTALAHVRLGDLASARKFFDRDNFYRSRLNLPEKKLVEYLSKLPMMEDAKGMEANILYTLGNEKDSYASFGEAAAYFRKAIDLFPRNGRFAYRYAELLMWLKRYDEALPMWALAVRFGNAHDAKEAKRRMSGWPQAQREAALREAAKLR